MGNPEHVAAVRGGAAALAQYYKEHPYVRLDLYQGDFAGCDLSGMELYMAELCEANFSNAVLRRAGFEHCDMMCATLEHADLTEANLGFCYLGDTDFTGAKMAGVDLEHTYLAAHMDGADLRNADISFARIVDAKVRNADFTDAYCSHSVFANVDLSEAKGLDHMLFGGPSSVGIDTLYVSKGRIPREFLRGCGVPDSFMHLWEGLQPRAFDLQSVFLCHSSKDREFCDRLANELRSRGVRVWYSSDDMRGGRKSYDQVRTAIASHERVILVLSKHSMSSDWVRTELRLTLERERGERTERLFPVSLVNLARVKSWECFDADTGRDLAADVRQYHLMDFADWRDWPSFSVGCTELVGALQRDPWTQ